MKETGPGKKERIELGGGFTLRAVGEQDRDLLTVWIEGDPAHRDIRTPDFYLIDQPGHECFAVEDSNEDVAFFVTMTKALRIDTQFGPDETLHERDHNAAALREGFKWLRAAASGSGVHEILFNTVNPPLLEFSVRRLAFKRSPDELSYRVAQVKTLKAKEKAAQ